MFDGATSGSLWQKVSNLAFQTVLTGCQNKFAHVLAGLILSWRLRDQQKINLLNTGIVR